MKTTVFAGVIDTIWGVWYEHLKRPAYKHLTNQQAKLAVELCEYHKW